MTHQIHPPGRLGRPATATARRISAAKQQGKIIYDAMLAGVDPRGKNEADNPHLETARVYILTPEAVDICLEAAARMPKSIPLPAPPAVPLWLEFAKGTLVADNAQVAAMYLLSERDSHEYGVSLLCTDSAPLGIFYHADTPRWQTMVFWPCLETGCPVAMGTLQSGPPDRFEQDPVFYVGPQVALETDGGLLCPCYQAGQDWIYFLAAFFYLLQAEGVRQEVITKGKGPRDKKGKALAPHKQYIRISLTKHIYTVRRGESGIELEPDEGDLAPMREITRRAHPRLLIAAPWTRWKTTRVVYVRATTIKRRVMGTIRYLVDE